MLMLNQLSGFGGLGVPPAFKWFGSGFSTSHSHASLTVAPGLVTAAATPGGSGATWKTAFPDPGTAKTTGKWYWEARLNAVGIASDYPSGMLALAINAGHVSYPLATGNRVADGHDGVMIMPNGSNQVTGVTLLAGSVNPAKGSITGFAVDADLGRLWIRTGVATWAGGLPPSGAPWATFTTGGGIMPSATVTGDGATNGASVDLWYGQGGHAWGIFF